jgi:hypothetical protein
MTEGETMDYAEKAVAEFDEPDSVLLGAIDTACKAESELGHLINVLATRLRPVLVDTEPAEQGEALNAVSPPTSDAVRRIRSHADAVRSQALRLERLIQRLES